VDMTTWNLSKHYEYFNNWLYTVYCHTTSWSL
jgi:hypothetical protein